MPDIVTAVPDVLTWADALSRSFSLSLSVSVSLCDSLVWHPAELGSRERASERVQTQQVIESAGSTDIFEKYTPLGWLPTSLCPVPLPRSPVPFTTPHSRLSTRLQLMSTSGAAAPFASAFGATLCRFVSSNVWTGPQGRDVITSTATAAARQKI